MDATQPPPLNVFDSQGRSWRRESPKASGRWITRNTGIAFVRGNGVVKLPYATYRRGNEFRHLAHDQIDDGRIVNVDD